MNKAASIALCFGILVTLMASAPMLAIAPDWLAPQLVTLTIAVMLLLLSDATAADIQRSVAIFKPLALAAILPAAWIVMQIVPVPPGSIENPVWRSAAAAVPGTASGHLSIDLGFTLRALFRYLGLISLAFTTTVLTRNRDRADTILFAICAITTFGAGELLWSAGLSISNLGRRPADLLDSLVATTAFGAILNAAFVVRTMEHYATRPRRQAPSRAYPGMMLFGIFGGIICLIDLICFTSADTLIAAASGLMVIGLAVVIRRLGLGRSTLATVGLATLVAWSGVIALRFAATPPVSPLLRFAKAGSIEADAPVLRLIADATWAGSGVGSYQALAAIHRDSSGAPGDRPINTVTSVLLEWGGLGMVAMLVLPLQLVIVLVRGALSRGRDSFYAAAAAACVVTAVLETYCDTSLGDISVQILAAISSGLGLAQTTGRHAS